MDAPVKYLLLESKVDTSSLLVVVFNVLVSGMSRPGIAEHASRELSDSPTTKEKSIEEISLLPWTLLESVLQYSELFSLHRSDFLIS